MELSGTRLKNQDSLVEHRTVREHSQIRFNQIFCWSSRDLKTLVLAEERESVGSSFSLQLYDTDRFCLSACIGTVLNPSSLREDGAAPADEQAEELLLRATRRKPACLGRSAVAVGCWCLPARYLCCTLPAVISLFFFFCRSHWGVPSLLSCLLIFFGGSSDGCIIVKSE